MGQNGIVVVECRVRGDEIVFEASGRTSPQPWRSLQMIYSALIYETPGVADARPGGEREKVLAAHRQLQVDSKQAGTFVAATQLSEAGAITIRHRKDSSSQE